MFDEVGELQFPQLEEGVLALWKERDVFETLRRQNRGGPAYSFLDGPITANNPRGLGVHHAWGRTYKDIFQRHRAMQGCQLRYQNGFDCQGLWVEVEVEKDLGLDGKRAIQTYGLERFARGCRERVDLSAQAIVAASVRLGQWMDWDNSYHTYSDENIEHIWRFLKECHRRGWLYRGRRVMPWCTRCGTSLSQHELAEAHEEVVHRAVYLALPLTERSGERILVWTTTPWTLPANTALAVHPELEYARVRAAGQTLVLARSAVPRLTPSAEVVEVVGGAELVGHSYAGPFDELPVQAGLTRRIVGWDQVDEAEGTGVVHLAPGCGAEDFALAEELDLPVLAPLREDGTYAEGYGHFAGESFSVVARLACSELQTKGLLHRTEEYAHRYPHCWRCGMELVFRLVGEWFIACDEVRPLMLDAVRPVRWIPEHSGKQMEDWLRNMGDWCISRKRYWGLPLPFYEDDDGHLVVVGSKAELRELAVDPDAVDALPELHRPWIDGVEIRTPGDGTAQRVTEVGDCWLDAGIVPFSTLARPDGEGKDFARWFPADFVVEMREQIRLWYYSMLFMSVVLDGRPPYRTVMTYEKMADENGKAMHKSAGNAIWFDEAVEHSGADPMRWLFAGQNLGLNISFGYGPLAEVKRRFLTLWNTYRFYVQYANLDGLSPPEADAGGELVPIDRWLRSRLHLLVRTVGQGLESYELPSTVRAMEEFIDDLSNWYVRLCRRRFWKNSNDGDKGSAHATLYEALTTLIRLMAPIVPFLAEEIYQNLVRSVTPDTPESVHLCAYPKVRKELIDEGLMLDMAVARQVVNLGRAVRAERGLRVRQPLSRVLVAGDAETSRAMEHMSDLVLQELNAKALEVLGHEAEISARVPGPDLATTTEGGVTVALDMRLDQGLVDEGVARDFVHVVQGLRRRHGLNLEDRIAVTYQAPEPVVRAVEKHAHYIRTETLCVDLQSGEVAMDKPCKVGGQVAGVEIRRDPRSSV